MTKAEFIKELATVMMVSEDELQPATELRQFESWDSTCVINLIVALDEKGIKVDEEKLPDCQTVKDIMDLAGVAA